jgi:hypothetical protein
MIVLPLQVIDNFLLQYNVGQALFLVFILAFLGAIPLKSRKVHAIQFISFGLIFMLTPQSLLEAPHWKFIGVALLVVGPMLYVTARK